MSAVAELEVVDINGRNLRPYSYEETPHPAGLSTTKAVYGQRHDRIVAGHEKADSPSGHPYAEEEVIDSKVENRMRREWQNVKSLWTCSLLQKVFWICQIGGFSSLVFAYFPNGSDSNLQRNLIFLGLGLIMVATECVLLSNLLRWRHTAHGQAQNAQATQRADEAAFA